MGGHEVLKPTATEMSEAIAIPESVTPEGLRARADIIRKAIGDESCARHLELAADEIARLKARRGSDDLEATAYGTAIEKTEKEMRLTLLRGQKIMGYLVFPLEKVYDFGTHILRLYDELEGI